ncbi:hypothetical protein XAP6164_3020045 [Xanthomonas phaseoli pv. phaseoli]|nr:hypothetical protein XAP6164_3020045 [Xanthomonas phaseoli pv. phaseoli]
MPQIDQFNKTTRCGGSALTVAALFGRFLDLVARTLHVLAGAGHGVAARHHAGRKQAQHHQCQQSLHRLSSFYHGASAPGLAPNLTARPWI